jgi:ribonuclease J
LETKIIVPGQKYVFDTITIEPYSVCHSIPDGVGLIIEAGETRIVHSGDFKLDNKPIDGKITDLPRLKRLKDVDLLLCDSTNADQQGHTCSESMVANTFKKIFSKTTGRIVIASFSSNVLRLQSVLTVAQEHNRRVCILGRNMQTAFTLAKQAGVIKCPPQTIFDIKQVSSLTDNKVVILTTGSQGEKMSALTQMSKGTFEAMRLKKEDTVIISAMPIPGNEPDINETVDRLHRIGVTLYYDQIDEIHASGHACADELKQLIKTVNPKYFIPIHGEYKHLLFNTELAHSVGVRKNNALIVRNGDQVDCDHDSCRVVNHVNGAPVLIDGNYFANPNEPMFDERYYLSRSGMLVVSILADDKQVLNDPVFNGYGCLYRAEIDTVLPDLKKMIIEQYKKTKGSNREREQFLRRELERVIYETVRRRPKVFVNILAA